jgi:hypothetical protein
MLTVTSFCFCQSNIDLQFAIISSVTVLCFFVLFYVNLQPKLYIVSIFMISSLRFYDECITAAMFSVFGLSHHYRQHNGT